MPRITIFLCLHKNGAAVRGSVLVAANTNTRKQNNLHDGHTQPGFLVGIMKAVRMETRSVAGFGVSSAGLLESWWGWGDSR